jgi:RNA polymerase sigma-70 factor (ECF subfamily)
MISDEALYERLLGGDLAAFDQLYERYERPLFGFIRKYLAETKDAEDVLHEAFLALLDERERPREARSLRAWLYQVARYRCLNQLRSGRREARALAAVRGEPRAPSAPPDLALLEAEAARALRRAVATLPQQLGEIYALRTGGLSYAELAEVLELPVGTVKSRMHQMVRVLREELKA